MNLSFTAIHNLLGEKQPALPPWSTASLRSFRLLPLASFSLSERGKKQGSKQHGGEPQPEMPFISPPP